MASVAASDAFLSISPTIPAYIYDEVFDSTGEPRPAWKQFVERIRHVSVAELTRRSLQALQLVYENGVTFNVHHEEEESQRPWSLDLLPVIFAAEEWEALSRGLRQRARLLDRVVQDCYGPRTLIQDGTLPPEVLFANPGFQRPFVALCARQRSMILYAAELARGPDGGWRVMADRAEAPAGLAFALENRIAVSRTIPPELHDQPVQRLAPFFQKVQNTLKGLGQRLAENPRIVLLSPGAKSPYYFEDVYLARYLGYSLVEGADLAVRDERVFLKTLAGLVPIDVILSRGVERGTDPLELGGGEPHGVPGLLKVVREGKVAVANFPGSGLAESPIFMAFLPQLCRRLLGEELLLPSIPTFWCGDQEQWKGLTNRLAELVIKPAFQASGGEEILVGRLDHEARQELLDRIAQRPYDYVAQDLIARSAVPVFRGVEMRTGHAALRTFLVADGEDFTVMPGGLVRVAPTPEPMELSISAGEGSKDLWVLADGEVQPVTLLSSADKPVPLRRTSAVFPSRVADDLFWLGQFLDRADFVSRLLRAVIERLTAESALDVPELPWLVHALADQGQVEPGFAIESFSTQLPTLAEELPRMVANGDEARGVASAVSELFRLASLERLWLSPDAFRKVRGTAYAFQAAAERWSGLVELLGAVNDLILDLAAVSGLIHDGMIRGPAWRVLDFGRRLERARNTANLLRSILSIDKPFDRSVLKSLLEIIDCRLTYRARYFENVQQNAVFDLCVTDETCPRSIASQVVALAEHVDAFPTDSRTLLRNEETQIVMAAVHAVRMISPEQLEQSPATHLKDLLGDLDGRLRALSQVVTKKYFLHSGAPRQIASRLELPQ
jgi:uncharacterized circularly permuted ATP-grasp superfamily protein/uncharacterized alpha-E superfamily protein